MKGVTILSSEFHDPWSFSSLIYLIVFTVLALGYVIINIITIYRAKKIKIIQGLPPHIQTTPNFASKYVTCWLAITLVLTGWCIKLIDRQHAAMRYTIQLDNNASYIEFVEAYKIIEEKDDYIFIVERK